jgi:hypothetical protein
MKIPENANPYRAIVNGVEHAYEAGAETTVAPGVEELINAADNFPPAAEEVQPPFAGGGGGGGALVVNVTETVTNDVTVYTADKTFSEISAAFPLVISVCANGDETNAAWAQYIYSSESDNIFSVALIAKGNIKDFTAPDVNSYPSYASK